MNPEVYIFALFVFALAYVFFIIVRRMRKKDPQSREYSFEQQNKLFRMYQNLEDMMDSFEAFAEEKQSEMLQHRDEVDERCQALEDRVAAIENKFLEMEEQRSAAPERNPMPVVRVPAFERVNSDVSRVSAGIERLKSAGRAIERDDAAHSHVLADAETRKQNRVIGQSQLGSPQPAAPRNVAPQPVAPQPAVPHNPLPVGKPTTMQQLNKNAMDAYAKQLREREQPAAEGLTIKRSYEPAFESLPPITLAAAMEETVVPFPATPVQSIPTLEMAQGQLTGKRERILFLRDGGMSEAQIARELGVTYTEVVMICGMARSKL